VEGRAHVQCDAGHLEEAVPHMAREDRSLSLMMEQGKPCRQTIPSKKAQAIEAAV
jgi:hypothetical protein